MKSFYSKTFATTLLLVSGMAQVNAAPITYEYTGPDFTSLSGSLGSAGLIPAGLTAVTATVTFSGPLIDIPELNTGANMAGSVLSFLISDGVTTITDATAGYDLFVSISGLDPDALAVGDFSKWSMGVSRPGGQHFGDADNFNISTFFDPGFSIVDKSNYCLAISVTTGNCNVNFQASASTGGAWSVVDDGGPVAVSVPGTFALFILGLAGLSFSARKGRTIAV